MQSNLAIFDTRTRTIETVLTTSRHIEAPNWTPDGAALIVNGEGRLFRVPLARPQLAEIDTGFATRLNNDHGISPDGLTLVISDSTRTDGSCIYTLPVAGGEPRRVTEETPSYWHGWSPDGADPCLYRAAPVSLPDLHLPRRRRPGAPAHAGFRPLRRPGLYR